MAVLGEAAALSALYMISPPLAFPDCITLKFFNRYLKAPPDVPCWRALQLKAQYELTSAWISGRLTSFLR